MQENPLILPLRLDAESRAFFNAQRQRYFPPERSYPDAHLKLFHQLPHNYETSALLSTVKGKGFSLTVTGFINHGGGIICQIESQSLQILYQHLSDLFHNQLIAQDRQLFKSYITIMNKSSAEAARLFSSELSGIIKPFMIEATRLDIWIYQGGPWLHLQTLYFR